MALCHRHAGAFGDLGKTDLCVRQQEAVHPAAMRARHMHQVQSGALKRGVIDVNAAVDVALMRRALEVYLAHSEILAHGLFSSSSQYCSVRFQTVNSEDCFALDGHLRAWLPAEPRHRKIGPASWEAAGPKSGWW
jgi:hypothetical protein